ncbi:MAG: tRNA threonylcarbamoyladenosine dehydratase [Lachnospiraceae bacterium]|nr:tRNA threonylcarbamoyladenosine dehydratase [Lachnospiraceae bacterium]
MFSRTELLIGERAVNILKRSRIAVFGLGGVGSYVVEALARSGVGSLELIDNDRVSPSNINRQLIALNSTIGRYKTDVARERILDINPGALVKTSREFYMPDNSYKFDMSQYDYVVDAIDTVTGKIEIIVNAKKAGTPVISSMGTGNKLDPAAFEIGDIYSTSICPLARVMRRELKKRGIKDLKVLYSKEEPLKTYADLSETFAGGTRKSIPGSIAFVPSVAGLIIAGEVIKDLTGCNRSERETGENIQDHSVVREENGI